MQNKDDEKQKTQPLVFDPEIMARVRELQNKEQYLDDIVARISSMKMDGQPIDDAKLLGSDLERGAEMFNLQEFSPKVQTDILLSLAYFRSPAFQERVDMSLGYAPGSEMTSLDAETYNSVVERAREAYLDISFKATDDITKSHAMVSFDGKTVVSIPDGNDQHELDSKLYSSLGVTTHEIAHHIYNSAELDSINPGIYHQDEGESLTSSESYGKENSPYNRINESNPGREQVAEWYKQKDLERVKDLYEGGILSKYKYDEYVQRISGMSTEQLMEHEHVDVKLRHDNTGFERAADVHAARMIMLHEGIWNPFSNEPLKPEHVEQFRQRHPDSRIFEYWNTREATYFLNTIAQNGQEKSPSVGQKQDLQQMIRDFDSQKFMSQLSQFSSFMSGGDAPEVAQSEPKQPAQTDSQQVGQCKPLSAETLMAMSAMNYEAEAQSLNESQQVHRSAGYHI